MIISALKTLPKVLAHSREATTQTAYIGAFNRFEKWTKNLLSVQALPANPESVAIYLLSLAQNRKSVATINQAVYAITWMHRICDFPNPTSNNMVSVILDGVRRLNSIPPQKKKPITPEILASMYSYMADDHDLFTLKQARIMCYALISYAGFLRFDETSQIRRPHLKFLKSHVSLFLPKSKTDVTRQGHEILIAKTDSTLCPVHFLKRYLLLAHIHREDDVYLFRNIVHCKSTGERKLIAEDKCFTYSVCRDELIKLLKDIQVDYEQYSLHSFRSGGATAAASAQVPDRLFKAHGRWKTDMCKDGYVEETLENRLRVSLNLGL